MKYGILLIVALVSAGTAAAQTSQRITAGKANEYGLTYTLPATAVDIYVEAELTEKQPGEFYNYARRHLSITDAVTAPSTTARVLSAVIVPRGIPDSDNRWTAQFKPGQAVSISLTDTDIPLGINTDGAPTAAAPAIPAARPAAPTPLEGDIARQAVTPDMVRSASVSKKAELAAQRIFELREMRSDILSGQADNMPSDGAAMQLVLDNLSAQEAALTAMFAGTTSTSTVVRKYTVIPDSTDVSGRVIGRLSAVDGLLDADNLAGSPITVDIKVVERGAVPVNEKGEPKIFPKGGVAYTVPGSANVSVNYNGNVVESSLIPVAQLGITFGINPALFYDKKAPYSATFDPVTGALINLAPVE
ncbi:MAG: DUF4831 family protein [Muribaculaceae bacterium]|nr:DUF4831 family protein [Muribaculaceae bacterium]